jgi:anti-anti-sigma regulatory factor
MSKQPTPVTVQLPAEIDVTNASDVAELIAAACVLVVIADLTATRFCDSTGLQHLILAGHKGHCR